MTFSGFGILQSGAGANTFNVTSDTTADLQGGAGGNSFILGTGIVLTGTIDGQAGLDTLNLSSYATGLTANLTGSDATGFSGDFTGSTTVPVTGGFTAIDDLIAGSGDNSLYGRDVASTWSLGNTETYNDGTATLTFSSFGTLQGGSDVNQFEVTAPIAANLDGGDGNDTFAFTDAGLLTGSIDGQGGVNTLDLSQCHEAMQVDLVTGITTMIAGTMANIQNVIGGTAANVIIGDSADNTLTSNGTNDQLAGGPGGDTYVLTLPSNSSTSVNDNQGDNSLDFSRAGTGMTLNLGSTAVQTVATGRQLQLNGVFTNVMGTPFADVISASATAYDRTISGGPADSASGDILQVDAGGRVASVTPTAVLIEGMGTIFYSHFSQVILVNQGLSDLVLSQIHTPEPARLHLDLTITLTVTNQGPVGATQVVLTDNLPTTMTYVSASSSQGDVEVNGSTLTASLEGLAVGATATVQVTLIPQAIGDFVNSAVAVAHQPNPNPDHAHSSATIDVVSNSTLQIASQSRQGSGFLPTSVVLQFNAPLDVSSATNLAHYTIIGPGRDGRLGTRDDVRIKILSASYCAATDTVVLVPKVRLCLSQAYYIRVSGVTSAYGNALDGNANGTSGSAYRAIFHGYNKYRHLVPRSPRRSSGLVR